MENVVSRDEAIEIWLQGISNRTEGTKKIYLLHFKKFMDWCGKTAEELRDMKWKEDENNKPWERNQVENLVRAFLHYMEFDRGYACLYSRNALNSIKSFFAKNGLPLNLDSNDLPQGEGIGGSRVPTNEEIRKIVGAAEYLRDRALILFLKDSGLRQSDVAKMKWKDLKDYGDGFYGFTILTKKRKTKAKGFIGPETTEILELYRKQRLQGTEKISPEKDLMNHPVFSLLSDGSKVFPPRNMSSKLGIAIRLAGFEDITPHGLRKFWEQNIHSDREAYIKQMNGRKLSADERAYLSRNPTDLFKIYRENYDNLRIQKQEFKEIGDRLRREYEREIKTLKDRIYELERERNEHRLTESQVKDLLRRIEKLEKQAQE